MENLELETKEEKTVTVTLTLAEEIALMLNLFQYALLAKLGEVEVIDGHALASVMQKFSEGKREPDNQSTAGQGGPQTSSSRSDSSGESSGASQMSLPWSSGLDS